MKKNYNFILIPVFFFLSSCLHFPDVYFHPKELRIWVEDTTWGIEHFSYRGLSKDYLNDTCAYFDFILERKVSTEADVAEPVIDLCKINTKKYGVEIFCYNDKWEDKGVIVLDSGTVNINDYINTSKIIKQQKEFTQIIKREPKRYLTYRVIFYIDSSYKFPLQAKGKSVP